MTTLLPEGTARRARPSVPWPRIGLVLLVALVAGGAALGLRGGPSTPKPAFSSKLAPSGSQLPLTTTWRVEAAPGRPGFTVRLPRTPDVGITPAQDDGTQGLLTAGLTSVRAQGELYVYRFTGTSAQASLTAERQHFAAMPTVRMSATEHIRFAGDDADEALVTFPAATLREIRVVHHGTLFAIGILSNHATDLVPSDTGLAALATWRWLD